MDINIGQINYKLFNKSINELLTEIGSELYHTQLENNNGISYEKFMESFCSMEKIKKYEFPSKIVVADPESRCSCRVWLHVQKEYRQCRRSKYESSEYCKKHKNKRNYGEIK